MINAAFAVLLGALVVFGIRDLSGKKNPWTVIGWALVAAAWLAIGVFLGTRWIKSGHAPMSNQYESVIFLNWAFLGLALLVGREFPVRSPGLWIALFSSLLLALASLLDSAAHPLVPALQSDWLLLHVSVTMAAYAALAIGFLSAIACLWTQKIRRRSTDKQFDGFAYRCISLGFVLLTIGIILGAVWANEAWGSYWSWDPKETWSLITWFVYALALHLHQTKGWRGSSFAAVNASGFLCVAFTYFGVNYLMSGLHAYR
ncbi:MAG: cytochrome c biogenesis protein CcsA [Elusimicrobiota bacterium]